MEKYGRVVNSGLKFGREVWVGYVFRGDSRIFGREINFLFFSGGIIVEKGSVFIGILL